VNLVIFAERPVTALCMSFVVVCKLAKNLP